MNEALWRALGICPGDVAAFTGGGGKTSLACRVATELRAAGRPVIFTTTAKMFPAPDMQLVLAGDRPFAAVLDSVAAARAEGANVCLGRSLEPGTGKLLGLDPSEVAELRSLGAGAVLVEADGAAGRPLKAPAPHEPVIPACSDLVVPVAGASALWRPLADPWVHRPEALAAVAGVAKGCPVTPEVLAAGVLACTRGGPAGARVVPVLGQADLAVPGLAEVAGLLLARPAAGVAIAGRVVFAAPATPHPVRRVSGGVAALVLAGGAARRFGGGKLTHPLDGRTVVEHALAAPLRAGLREVVVVTGAAHEALVPLLAPYPVRVVHNPAWEEGMASSLRAGLAALASDPPEAVLICLGDQPRLPAGVLSELAAAWRRTGAPVVAPTAGGQRRNPVLFDRCLWDELSAVRGDEGGRSLLRAHRSQLLLVPFPEPGWFADVDTPGDLGAI